MEYYPTLMVVNDSELLQKIDSQIDFLTNTLSKLQSNSKVKSNSITIDINGSKKVIEFTKSEKIRKVINELEMLFQLKDIHQSKTNNLNK